MIDYLKYFVVILLAFLISSTFIPVAFNQLQNQREEDRREREEEDEEKRQNELVVEVARQREEARQLQANVSALEPCPASAACEPPAEPPASCDPARVGFGVICPDDLKRAQEQGVVTRDIVGDIALLGFGDKGQLPIVGSTILIGPGEKLWIEPLELVLVSIVDFDQSIVSQSLLPPVINSQIELPQVTECCGKTFEYNLIISRVTMQQLRAGEFPQEHPLFVDFLKWDVAGGVSNFDEIIKKRFPVSPVLRGGGNVDAVDNVGVAEGLPAEIMEFFPISQVATLIIVGPDEPASFDIDLELKGFSASLSKDSSLGLALLRPSSDHTVFNNNFGTIRYPSVINPDSEYRIFYNTSVGALEERDDIEVLEMVLESPRQISTTVAISSPKIELVRNGSVSSSTLAIESHEVDTVLEIPSIGNSLGNGNSPLQFGLHHLHIYSSSLLPGSFNVYLPVYVVPEGKYQLISYSATGDDSLDIDLSLSDINDPILYYTTETQGVVTSINSQSISLPISKITVKDNLGSINLYKILIQENYETSFSNGTTYILGNSYDDRFSIESLKINNFTVNNFEISGQQTDIFGFPETLEIITDLNTIDIMILDEFDQPYINGIILIENDNEHFEFPLTSSPKLRLNDGDYKILHIVDGITMSTNEIRVSNSDSLTFYIDTLTLQDQLLTVAILLEVVIVLFLTFRLVRTYYQS